MTRVLSHREKQSLWETWVRKPIFADKSPSSYGARMTVLFHFVKAGLFPFVRGKGYVFFDNETKVTNSLLRYLFALHVGDKVVFKNPHQGLLQDHINEFDHRFDGLELESFWERWGEIEDFQEGRTGYEFRFTLFHFLWASINIQDSPISRKIEAILEEEDSEMMEAWRQKSKDDPYLQDTSKINYEDRHWH